MSTTGTDHARRRSRGLIAACALWLGASWPAPAAASDLSWSGPADCARSEQLLFQVERALGAPLAETGNVHLQVHVTRAAPTARALLRIADDAAAPALSERRLVAPDCDKLVDTLAVAIALAIEAAAPETPVAPQPALASAAASGPPRGEPALQAIPALPPPPAPAENARDTSVTNASSSGAAPPAPTLHVSARVLGDVGSLPAPAIGAGVGAALGWSLWRLELSGALWGERHASLESASIPGAGADLSLITGALGACALPLRENSIELALCASWEMGRVSGVGTGITSPRRASGLWLAPGAEVGLTWRPAATRFGVGARAGHECEGPRAAGRDS